MKPEIVRVDDPYNFISSVQIYEWTTIDGAKIYFVYVDCHEKYLGLHCTESYQEEITYIFGPKVYNVDEINDKEVAITFKNIEIYNDMKYVINVCEGQRYSINILYIFYNYIANPPKLIAEYDCEHKND